MLTQLTPTQHQAELREALQRYRRLSEHHRERAAHHGREAARWAGLYLDLVRRRDAEQGIEAAH